MSGDTVAYDIDLFKLEDFIEYMNHNCGDLEIYPRFVIEYMTEDTENNRRFRPTLHPEEDWFAADKQESMLEWLKGWDTHGYPDFNSTIYIDVYYQESRDTIRDYISRVYQHKDYTVEDIEKLI
jgi:hypothetical protein